MTDRPPYPSEKQDRFIVRLPDGMRDRIKFAAEQNNRSMNAEIVATLEEKYPDEWDFGEAFFVVHQLAKQLRGKPVVEWEAIRKAAWQKLSARGHKIKLLISDDKIHVDFLDEPSILKFEVMIFPRADSG